MNNIEALKSEIAEYLRMHNNWTGYMYETKEAAQEILAIILCTIEEDQNKNQELLFEQMEKAQDMEKEDAIQASKYGKNKEV
jgi:hypothetical protein